MSAQLKENAVPAGSQMVEIYLATGKRVDCYRYPIAVLNPVAIYGSITEGYPADVRARIEPYLRETELSIFFEKDNEGRPYSLAQRLREMGFTGELHATGNINRELMYHLVRVGFTHVHLPEHVAEIAQEIVFPFSGAYQKVFGEST
jgi:Bacterial protein of unknown function (DUF934)